MNARLRGTPDEHDALANRLVESLIEREGLDGGLNDRTKLDKALVVATVRCTAIHGPTGCGLTVGAVVKTEAGPMLIDLPAFETPYLLDWDHLVPPSMKERWDAYYPPHRFSCIRHGTVQITWDTAGHKWRPNQWNRKKATIPARANRGR